MLLEDYQNLIKRLRKHNVRALLRQKARYLGKKTGLDSDVIADLRASLGNGELKIGRLKQVPAHTTYMLIHWAFESVSESQGYGFPFDRPHLYFYRRLKEIHHQFKKILDIDLYDKVSDNRPYIQVKQLIEEVLDDKELEKSAKRIEDKAKVFDQLREALHIALPDGKNGINDNGDESEVKSIEKKVTEFREWLVSDDKRNESKHIQK